MPDYVVVWSIQVYAETAEKAAEEARSFQMSEMCPSKDFVAHNLDNGMSTFVSLQGKEEI